MSKYFTPQSRIVFRRFRLRSGSWRQCLLAGGLFAVLLFSAGSRVPVFPAGIVATIDPLGRIAKDITRGTDVEIEVLIAREDSVHGFRLKPSQVAKLHEAKLVLAVSENLESFAEKAMEDERLAPKFLLMENHSPNRLKPGGESAEHEGEEHHAEHERHDHEDHSAEEEHHHENHSEGAEHEHDHDHGGEFDVHYWLDPQNATAYAQELVSRLSPLFPEHGKTFADNFNRFRDHLQKTVEDWRAKLASEKPASYVVYHDAYRYLEKALGIRSSGVLLSNPDISMSARKPDFIEELIRREGVRCLYAEPQFNPELVARTARRFNLKLLKVDPLNGNPSSKSDGYADFFSSVAASFFACNFR